MSAFCASQPWKEGASETVVLDPIWEQEHTVKSIYPPKELIVIVKPVMKPVSRSNPQSPQVTPRKDQHQSPKSTPGKDQPETKQASDLETQ